VLDNRGDDVARVVEAGDDRRSSSSTWLVIEAIAAIEGRRIESYSAELGRCDRARAGARDT